MASVQTVKPVITPLDRFGLTLSLAILCHALLVLGVTFAKEDHFPARFNSMEIVLVQQKSPEPKEAKMLAQANLEGGGDVEELVHPSSRLPALFPDQKLETVLPQTAKQKPPQPSESATTKATVSELAPVKKEPVETLVVKGDKDEIPNVEKIKTPSKEKKVAKTTVKKSTKKPSMPTAAQLLTNSLKIAALSAEIRRKEEAKANRPRRKTISASTKEYKYAAYMEAWRTKVERIGNLNYPEQARKQKISGSLMLNVALRADGTIDEITIRRSSGKKLLDDAAIRIVELSAPFAPFPQQIKDEVDILNILRTWQFLDGKGFSNND